MSWNNEKESLFFLAYFILFWVTIFSYDPELFAGLDRYFIIFYLTFIFFFSGIFLMIEKKVRFKSKKLLSFSIILLFFLLFVPYALKTRTMYDNPLRLLETKIPELAEKDIPHNYTIILLFPIVLTSTTELNTISVDNFFKQNFALIKNDSIDSNDSYSFSVYHKDNKTHECVGIIQIIQNNTVLKQFRTSVGLVTPFGSNNFSINLTDLPSGNSTINLSVPCKLTGKDYLFFDDWHCLNEDSYICDKIRQDFILKPYKSYYQDNKNFTFYSLSLS
jgi:hypothetical protein